MDLGGMDVKDIREGAVIQFTVIDHDRMTQHDIEGEVCSVHIYIAHIFVISVWLVDPWQTKISIVLVGYVQFKFKTHMHVGHVFCPNSKGYRI